MGSVNPGNENKAKKLAAIPHAPGERFRTLQVVNERETSMKHPYGRQWYLQRGSQEMAPIGPRKGNLDGGKGVEMIRLGDVPDVEQDSPTVLRLLGPDYLVPKDPNDPNAQRTILHPYSWGEMGGSRAAENKAAKQKREAAEKAATKKAKKKAR